MLLSPSTYLLKIPPKREALRHSGGERRLFTSAMVTLYFEVELSRDKRPGTEQNRSVGLTTQVPPIHKRNVKAGETSYSVLWKIQSWRTNHSIAKLWLLLGLFVYFKGVWVVFSFFAFCVFVFKYCITLLLWERWIDWNFSLEKGNY